MVSTLAGLRRLEAQLYRAMMEAGARGVNPPAVNVNHSAALQQQAESSMAKAEAVLDGTTLDISA